MSRSEQLAGSSGPETVGRIDLSECPECGGGLRSVGCETVCVECGLVVEVDRLDRGPEWRACTADSRKRTGAPLTVTRHDRGLSTEIGWNWDANGTPVSGSKRRQLARMRREHARGQWQSKADRNLAYGLGEVQRMMSALELSSAVREQACVLFRRAQSAELLPGRSIEGMAAASVYAACRCSGLSRTLSEISDRARIEYGRVKATYTTLNTEFGLPTKPLTPSAYISRLASECAVSTAVERRARSLALAAEEAEITIGCQPSGFAAACLYTAAQEHSHSLTQAGVAAAANTSTQTVRVHRDAVVELEDTGCDAVGGPSSGRL